MQVFQQFVQQQAKGRMQTQFQSSSGSKRVGSFDGQSLGQPNAKRINKGPWPPLGTGRGLTDQRRPTASASVQEEFVIENEQSNHEDSQNYFGGMAGVGGQFMGGG